MADSDRIFTDQPECPYCGHVQRDAWEFNFGPGVEGDTAITCGECGEDFMCYRHATIYYRSFKIELEP